MRDFQLLENQVRGLLNSQTIRIEEKGYLLQLMHDVELRDCLADVIGEINQPLELANYECMKLLADILRFVMTLFVHE